MRPSANSSSRSLSFVLATVLGVAGCAADAPTAARPVADAPALARADAYSEWAPATSIELLPPGAHPSFNTPFLDGCPAASRDGLTFYLASTRPGGMGGIDIWVSTRRSTRDPWGPPVNVGPPVNSAADDFCPMPARDGHGFYFVSSRAGGCGGADVYVTRLRRDAFEAPHNLGCEVNSAADEAGPVPVHEPGRGLVLYFSSTRPGGASAEPSGAASGDSDLYASVWRGGAFGPAALVPGVNTAAAEGQPYVRRDALELYFFSNRPGAIGGSNDIYVATREKARDAWSGPANLGPSVNTAASETRPSLSWDGATLYFGSTRATGEGMSDIYVTTRDRLRGRGE
jgi:hypothetical protein